MSESARPSATGFDSAGGVARDSAGMVHRVDSKGQVAAQDSVPGPQHSLVGLGSCSAPRLRWFRLRIVTDMAGTRDLGELDDGFSAPGFKLEPSFTGTRVSG
eukprot:gene11774-biopygen2160